VRIAYGCDIYNVRVERDAQRDEMQVAVDTAELLRGFDHAGVDIEDAVGLVLGEDGLGFRRWV
jgi:hypothetical protein